MIKWFIENSQLCNAIISIATVIISMIAIAMSIITYYMQKKFNTNSVKPLLVFELVDLDERIAIKLKNYGMGVGIIKEVKFLSMNSGQCWKNLLKAVEEIDNKNENRIESLGIWKRYIEIYKNHPVPANGECIILEIEKPKNIELDYIRDILKEIEVKLTYSDIYQKLQTPISYDFSYFERRAERKINI